jgi:hypothetical protein
MRFVLRCQPALATWYLSTLETVERPHLRLL